MKFQQLRRTEKLFNHIFESYININISIENNFQHEKQQIPYEYFILYIHE